MLAQKTHSPNLIVMFERAASAYLPAMPISVATRYVSTGD